MLEQRDGRGSCVAYGAALLLALTACTAEPPAPVFLWHSVGEGSGDVYDLTPAEFDRELSELEASHATAVTLDDLFDAMDGRRPLPPRAVVLTFDDGRACLYTQALPLLLKHHFKAELFVVTSFLGEDAAHRQVRRDRTGAHPYLTWPELQEMLASGAFVIESHSVTHRRLPSLGLEAQRAELRDSARVLRERLHVPVHFFAYPFGSSDQLTQAEAADAGYRGAMSVDPRQGLLRLTVPRISIRAAAGAIFDRQVARLQDR